MKRYEPHLEMSRAQMTSEHKMIQFNARPDMQVSAYQMFQFHVQMIQSFLPDSRIFFTGSLDNSNQMFSDCYRLEHMLQPENCEGTILPLNTADGTLPIPSM